MKRGPAGVPAKVPAREGPAAAVPCSDCDKVFAAKRGMNRHRVLKHGCHASGIAATQETIDRYDRHGRHQPKVPAKVPVKVPAEGPAKVPATVVTAVEIGGPSVDEIALAVAGITDPVDEVSP